MMKNSGKDNNHLFDKDGRLTKEAIERAHSVPIVEFLESQGYQLEKQGKGYYRMVEHDSFVINANKNAYVWNSRGRKGRGAVSILTDPELFNYNYRNAIIELNKPENERLLHEGNVFKEKPKEPYVYPEHTITKDEPTKVINYLVNERKINKDLVEQFVNKGMIKQDKRNNAFYPWYVDGHVVGHNVEGTYVKEGGHRFKQINENGDQSRGFKFQTGKSKVENYFFFESEVDAMSYVSLNGLTPNSKYMAMRGVNNEALVARELHEYKDNHDKFPNIILGADNDKAGLEFNERIINIFNQAEISEELSPNIFVAQPPGKYKDWNDCLKDRDGKPFEQNERTNILTSDEFIAKINGQEKDIKQHRDAYEIEL
ncbi:DUF3991 and toprim domain-containing protein [Macrococcus capreoli]